MTKTLQLPALRHLTKKPPENFHHKALFLALNSAMNLVPADLNVNNPEALARAKRRQKLYDFSIATQSMGFQVSAMTGLQQPAEEVAVNLLLPQVNEDFDIAQYWKRPMGSHEYYTPQAMILNQKLTITNVKGIAVTVSAATQFIPALTALDNKIREKKMENEFFNDLFFAELYLASMSLAALIMSNRSVWTGTGSNIAYPMPQEMSLLTRTITLTNAILDNPSNPALTAQILELQVDIKQHLDDYENDPIVRKSQKAEFWMNLLEITMWTALIIACIAFIGGAVCLAMGCPAGVIPLACVAMGFATGDIIVGVASLCIDSQKIDDMKDCAQRTRERQVAILRFFDATEKLVNKELPRVDNQGAHPSPT